MKTAMAALILILALLPAGCGGAASEKSASDESSQTAAVQPEKNEISESGTDGAGSGSHESSGGPDSYVENDETGADPFEALEQEEEEEACSAPEEPVYEDTRNRAEIKADMLAGTEEWRSLNSDTVGWLYIADTTIDSPVLQSGDNLYYLKHNEYLQEDRNGALMADYRDVFGGRENMSRNIVIYAHSKDENPDGGVEASREYEHFTELKRYQDIAFCRENPYIMFAADGDAMVWEIFAVFHTKTSFMYNIPNPTTAKLTDILDEARQKSLFNFDTEVTAEDNILTLSTCCRRIVPTYPNGYRFVIMAKLIGKGVPLKTADEISITENPDGLSPWNIYE